VKRDVERILNAIESSRLHGDMPNPVDDSWSDEWAEKWCSWFDQVLQKLEHEPETESFAAVSALSLLTHLISSGKVKAVANLRDQEGDVSATYKLDVVDMEESLHIVFGRKDGTSFAVDLRAADLTDIMDVEIMRSRAEGY
jgi:hypothetical protein